MTFEREDRENLGPPPPPFRMGQQAPPRGRGNRWVFLVAIALILVVLAGAAKELYIDWLWFESLNYTSIFETILLTRAVLFAAGALGVFLFVYLNLMVARRLAPRPLVTVYEGPDLRLAGRMITLSILALSVLLAVVFGSSLSGEWQRVVTAQHSTPFGQVDPVFGDDISFYVFQLPALRYLQGWVLGIFALTLLASLILYALALTLGSGSRPGRGIKVHVAVLGAGILLFIAFNYWLARHSLLLDASAPGAAFGGPGYTDLNVRLQVLTAMMGIAGVTAVLVLASVVLRGALLPAIGVVALVAVGLLGNIYAQAVQSFQVRPNELARERPYIQNNINATRAAFGLDRIEEVAHPGNTEPSLQELTDNPETLRNIRLWDHDPLKSTYEQIQAIRRYYQFVDVDIDRYTLDGQYRQVMLSARELAPDNLALEGQPLTWVNEHLKFTHGYGVALSPVNEIADNRLPNLFVKDLPPVISRGADALKIERPEVYFGEKTNQWVIVNTQEQEVDFASGAETKFTNYSGEGGVQIGSLFRRALFAWEFSDPNILLTDLKPESRILYDRTVQERVRKLAPFLMLDKDPYLVISNGRLVYIQDGYTFSRGYPYSQAFNDTQPGRPLNRVTYMRNSVKAVVDAYDGSVDFYISDPSDPIIATYAKVFPGTFKPLDQMPAGLRQHMRYPEDLFKVQSEVYRNYHMQDPQIFYNREDSYTRPLEIYLDKEVPMDPYYVIMRLPGQPSSEFMLILPFTPVNKNNANAWLAGRSDGDHYGKLLAFKFPNDKLVFGPRQIESRIDQDDRIADQFGKWKNSGSTIIRGNLLFVPVGDSYIYVEPIYLQSQQSKLPELTRVVVAAGERIEMEGSLEDSLNRVFRTSIFRPVSGPGSQVGAGGTPATSTPGAQASATPTPAATATATVTASGTPGPTGTPAGTVPQLARQAQDLFNLSQERLKAGDWQGYGQAQQQLSDVIKRMAELAGQP